MEKVCKDCKELLVLGENWTEGRRKAWVYLCKTCNRQRGKKHYEENREHYHQYNVKYTHSQKDGLYHVYILPDNNYAGSTTNVWQRMVGHRTKGRVTDSMRVIHSTPNREEAWELEKLLHDLGYEGRHAKTLI